MKAHELRVHIERQDLTDKLDKLKAFVLGVKFIDLDPTDKALLRAQFAAMQAYAEILEMRVARFKAEP